LRGPDCSAPWSFRSVPFAFHQVRLLAFLGSVVPHAVRRLLERDSALPASVDAPVGEPGPGEVESKGLPGLHQEIHLGGGVALNFLDDANPLLQIRLGALSYEHVVELGVRLPAGDEVTATC